MGATLDGYKIPEGHSLRKFGEVEYICNNCGYVLPRPLSAYWAKAFRKWGGCSGQWLIKKETPVVNQNKTLEHINKDIHKRLNPVVDKYLAFDKKINAFYKAFKDLDVQIISGKMSGRYGIITSLDFWRDECRVYMKIYKKNHRGYIQSSSRYGPNDLIITKRFDEISMTVSLPKYEEILAAIEKVLD